MVIAELLHQTYLRLLLHRLVGRAVLTHTEGIVSPDELDREFHQSRHPDGRFHIVGEYEESAAGRDHAAVKCHTYAAAGHRKLGHAGLEEGATEVVCSQGASLLEEAVGLVGVGKVRGSAYHIRNLLGED